MYLQLLHFKKTTAFGIFHNFYNQLLLETTLFSQY